MTKSTDSESTVNRPTFCRNRPTGIGDHGGGDGNGGNKLTDQAKPRGIKA
jgi:hypothetical protein